MNAVGRHPIAARAPVLMGLAAALLLAVPEARAQASDWARTDVSQVRLVAAVAAVGQAQKLTLGLQFQLDPGWKIYWRSPGDAGSPPRPDFAGSANLAAVAMQWPAPVRFHEAAGIETVGYTDETVFPLAVSPARPGEPLSLRARVDYQACEQICIPFTADLALDLPAGEAAPTSFVQLIERYQARVPREPERAGITVEAVGVAGAPPDQTLELVLRSPVAFAAPDLIVEAPDRIRVAPAEAALAEAGRVAMIRAAVDAPKAADLVGKDIRLTVIDGERAFELALAAPAASGPIVPAAAAAPAAASLAAILAVALLGGLILNLMPCVLPVLSLKLLGAIGHGGAERRHVALSFVAAAAGIVVSFLVLAAAAVAVKAAGGAVGWGIQFQHPGFLVFLVLVLALFAYNLLGLYEIGLPGWLGDASLQATGGAHPGRGIAGHFVTGAFATLLATPCSAPFVGTALGFALSRGAGEIFAVFAALGLGMAAPYLLVAAFPGLATGLPRPGRWMVWLRAVLGLALLGTAAWLVSVLAAQAGARVALAVAGAAALVAAVILLSRRGRRLTAVGYAGLALLAAAAFAAPALWARAPGEQVADAAEAVAWRPFDPAALAEAVAAGRTVFVDVTADWCVTCKVNKRLVLDGEAVSARLGAPDIVRMRADWTRPDDSIARYLASFGRYGIPFNVVYGPNARDGLVLPELLTVDAVLGALDRAG